ncbi:wax ester/triacylglycerol synthase family O-acyltransferase [Microtetraspora sp. AC03309]|uniref:wax ester/triacylglycerol synthase family O-acyltransferase n=1 Tax=Microtetraspora sp. AC03309 TaxID=2779376 RepID=UPI001E29DB51|nr:wax ester/triacylglycerol synthase family O-acyltransferase [Microtetraspora sp. AC03309]MCC5581678.1 wax ester/triacylglycerol synthase family O-acyltransferase [Microtetraspora sp. AC03309]
MNSPVTGARYSRLSAIDRMMLRVERPAVPQHVAGLCLVEAPPWPAAAGELDMDAIRDRLERRLVRVPELRRVLRRAPLLCGPPLWVDDPGFSIEHHVHAMPVPAPGDETALLETAERLLRDRFDRSRPLWDLWLLTGLENGRVGLLFRVHHALTDGLAAIALVSALLDLEAGAADPPPTVWRPAPAPSGWALLCGNARDRLSALGSVLVHPMRTARSLAPTVGFVTRLLPDLNAAPRTSLNAPIGTGRRLGVLRLDLKTAREVAHAHGATVNDLILTIVMGGVRELMLGRGESVTGLELVVVVPATIRNPAEARELGNAVGALSCRLPAGEPDSARRLDLVAAATRDAKATQHLSRQISTLMYGLLGWLSVLGLPMENHQRSINLQVSNLPGPEVPLYLLGARIEDVMPITALTGNLTLTVAALSYHGRLNLTVIADRRRCPDVDVLIAGMRRSWAEMEPEAHHAPTRVPDDSS